MTVQMGNPVDMNEDDIIQYAFEAYMEDYELDTEMAFADILYEMFAAGFESAIELIAEEDEE